MEVLPPFCLNEERRECVIEKGRNEVKKRRAGKWRRREVESTYVKPDDGTCTNNHI